MSNARMSERAPFFAEVDVLQLGADAPRRVWGVDVSEGGMFLQTTHPFRVGDKISLRFDVPLFDTFDNAHEVHVRAAEVRWVRAFEPIAVDGKMPGIGLRFLALDPPARAAIRRYTRPQERDNLTVPVREAVMDAMPPPDLHGPATLNFAQGSFPPVSPLLGDRPKSTVPMLERYERREETEDLFKSPARTQAIVDGKFAAVRTSTPPKPGESLLPIDMWPTALPTFAPQAAPVANPASEAIAAAPRPLTLPPQMVVDPFAEAASVLIGLDALDPSPQTPSQARSAQAPSTLSMPAELAVDSAPDAATAAPLAGWRFQKVPAEEVNAHDGNAQDVAAAAPVAVDSSVALPMVSATQAPTVVPVAVDAAPLMAADDTVEQTLVLARRKNRVPPIEEPAKSTQEVPTSPGIKRKDLEATARASTPPKAATPLRAEPALQVLRFDEDRPSRTSMPPVPASEQVLPSFRLDADPQVRAFARAETSLSSMAKLSEREEVSVEWPPHGSRWRKAAPIALVLIVAGTMIGVGIGIAGKRVARMTSSSTRTPALEAKRAADIETLAKTSAASAPTPSAPVSVAAAAVAPVAEAQTAPRDVATLESEVPVLPMPEDNGPSAVATPTPAVAAAVAPATALADALNKAVKRVPLGEVMTLDIPVGDAVVRRTFTLGTPPRLVVDLDGGSLPTNVMLGDGARTQRVRFGHPKPNTSRIVVELADGIGAAKVRAVIVEGRLALSFQPMKDVATE